MTNLELLEALAEFIKKTGTYPWCCDQGKCCGGVNLRPIVKPDDANNDFVLSDITFNPIGQTVSAVKYGKHWKDNFTLAVQL